MVPLEGADEYPVLFRLQRAGGINQGAPWPQLPGGVFQEGHLEDSHLRQMFGLPPPAQVRPAGHNAGAGAGCIHQDLIGFRNCLGGGVARIEVHVIQAQAAEGAVDQVDPVVVDLVGQYSALRCYAFGQGDGFATGSGAEVDNNFPGVRIHCLQYGPGRGVLNNEQSFLHYLRLKQGGW
ncbi:hypothetical protein ES703_70049 [subsurface metagenome]